MLFRLLFIKLLMVKGSLRSDQDGRHRMPVFGILSAIFWVGLFRSSYWVCTEAMKIEPVGELLIQKLLSIVFLVFLGLLSFSNIVTTFSTFYLADELEFLVAQPIPKDQLFASRFLEALTQSSWVVFIFGLPIFFAAGFAVDAGWQYYVVLSLVLIPFVAIPTSVAAMLSLGITNILAADRTRDAMLFIGVAAFSMIFIVIRALRPERLLNPESFESIGEMMDLLAAPTSPWLPSDWCMSTVVPLLWGTGDIDAGALALLLTTPTALYFAATWLYRPYYARGYSKAQEGRHGVGVVTRMRDWAMKRKTTQLASLENRLEKLAAEVKVVSTTRQLIRKDRAIFARDASQWSQILIVFAILVIYLVNYKYFEIAADTKLFGEAGLYYFNLAACGFVIVALGGRFLFPAVSVEGKSFWLILQAPVSLNRFLIGKWLGGIGPTLIVGQILIWASNLLVLQNPAYSIMASLMVFVFSMSTGAMATGLGAIYPQFHNANAAKIASSFGAVIYMILGMFVVIAMLVFMFRLTLQIGTGWDNGHFEVTRRAILNSLVGLAIPIFVGWLALNRGAASLRSRF